MQICMYNIYIYIPHVFYSYISHQYIFTTATFLSRDPAAETWATKWPWHQSSPCPHTFQRRGAWIPQRHRSRLVLWYMGLPKLPPLAQSRGLRNGLENGHLFSLQCKWIFVENQGAVRLLRDVLIVGFSWCHKNKIWMKNDHFEPTWIAVSLVSSQPRGARREPVQEIIVHLVPSNPSCWSWNVCIYIYIY